ncbi:MAG: glycosyltransferase [Desulfobacteraceae bacterium]|nr:MAG: glycosyltransferase [Desulfobacteraceae bacterium]
MGKNIGFVSTRFAGTDGVSLESSKWREALVKNGHRCYWFAGELDRSPERSFLVPAAHFQHERIEQIDREVFGKKKRSSELTDEIHALKVLLKRKLREFIEKFDIDLLIVENALTIPMNVPLGLAITELVAETLIPTIAHHHDFYWERVRFALNAVGDYIRMAFPPNLPSIEHVVINSAAQEELALRTGISSTIIPNVLDFENPPVVNIERTEAFRESIGLEPGDLMILQPTRIIQRKGIEHAIELVKELKNPRCKLVISHEAGDEGMEYAEWLNEEARNHGVDLRTFNARMLDPLNDNGHPQKQQFSLWDVYPHADFITYPSLYEGFGNAFLEAVYFKKPILINRYSIFVRDIEPREFDLAVMDGFLTRKTVEKIRKVLEDPEERKRMVDRNYEIARRYYSFAVLERWLKTLFSNFFGMNV